MSVVSTDVYFVCQLFKVPVVMRVLVVEDDVNVSKSLVLALKSSSMVVDAVFTISDAKDYFGMYQYDIILLDLVLPDGNGSDFLEYTRASNKSTPILVLSGLDGEEEKVKNLNLGADDYITKPFKKDEIIARIKAIARRSKGFASAQISAGGLVLDINKMEVTADGAPVVLTTKEYRILELLMSRKNKVITKDNILDYLYDGMDEPEPKIVDVFVCKLRKKIQNVTGKNVVETVWGQGYIIKD